jgi:hypothetical protein
MKKRVFLSVILVLAMVFSMLPQFGLTAFAASDESTIDVSDSTGTLPEGVTYDSGTKLFTIDTGSAETTITVTGTTSENTIAVADDVTGLTLVLSGVSITSPSDGKSPIELQGTANVTVQLADDTTNTLLNTDPYTYSAGLRVPSSASVAINGDTGSLTAIGGFGGAAIGGSCDGSFADGIADGGTINISGGNVTAYGGSNAAGIGGGFAGSGGTINISGGTITAISDFSYNGGGAGIGGGYSGSAGIINITGSPIIIAAAQGPTSYSDFRNTIDAAGGSSGTIINAVLDNVISSSTTYLECNGNVLALPAVYQCFAFSAAAASTIRAYSDASCTTLLGNIVTTPGSAGSIPITDLSSDPTNVTPVTVSTEVTPTCDGSGTSEDPYIITDSAQLNELRNYLGSDNAGLYWKLGNDIDLSSYNGGEWVPIGEGENTFDCHVDGGGHKITGLQMTGGGDYLGLFNVVNGEIKNLGVELGPDGIIGGMCVGGFAGYLDIHGAIDRCYVTGNVSGRSYVGGLVGAASGDISNSHVTGSVSGTGDYIGGLEGTTTGDISSSYATCDVSGYRGVGVGGLVGASDPEAGEIAPLSISECYATGDVSGVNAVGGLVGGAYGSISNSYASGSVSGEDDFVGGLAGMFSGDISNSYAAGSVSENSASHGALVGVERIGPVTSCYYDSTVNAEIRGVGSSFEDDVDYNDDVTGKSTVDMMKKSTFTGWDFESIWGIHEGSSYPYLRGDAPADPTASAITKAPAANGGFTVKVGGTEVTEAEAGDTVTLTAMPSGGYSLSSWSVYKTGDTSTTVMMNANTFTMPAYPVTVEATFSARPAGHDHGGDTTPPSRTITVTETTSGLFSASAGEISAEANMENAFSNSVEVKVTDTTESASSFGLGTGGEVYPFDISLYIKGTNEKTEPAAGYAVTISLPVPESLLDKKDMLSIVHKSDDGIVTTLASQLVQRNGVWYLVFEATEFSPYALVVRNVGTYDASAGVPYYLDAGNKVFIGFAANGKYIAPEGVSVSVTQNDKSFTDVPGHWAAQYIGFVTEREIFVGTGGNTFSPDTGMTRAMFTTVIGRLYERSYGEITASDTHAFTDCDYGDYYGKYVDWATENGIIGGYGNGKFGPNDKVTREQMAAILYRFADFIGVLPSSMDTVLDYPDAGSISDYAKTAALYCQTTGVIGGRTGGVFAPKETATRAEVAATILRFVEAVVK